MRTSEHLDKIAPAIAELQRRAGWVAKGGENTYDKYSYAKLENYVAVLKELMGELGLSIITSIPVFRHEPIRKTANGKDDHVAVVEMQARALHTSGQWVEIDCVGEGQDRGDKGVYKAITGGRKYALACLCGLATSDDPENDGEPERPTAPPPAQRATAKQSDKAADPLAAAIAKWSGVPASSMDFAAACRDTVRAAGFGAGKLSDTEKADLLARVNAAINEKVDWAVTIAAAKKEDKP